MTEWMLRRGRRPPVGPVTTQRLIRAIKVGRVPPDTEATKVGSDEWRPYSLYPELELTLDSGDVSERPSGAPLLRLDSQRAGPDTARSPGAPAAAAAPGALARPSSPRASEPASYADEDDEDEATQVVVSTPFAAPPPETPSERPAPRPAAGVPPPKPPGWSSRPGPPSQPAVRAAPSATSHARPAADPRPAAPRPAAAVPRPAAGVAAPPRPTPSRLSSPIAVPPPSVPSSPRGAVSRPSTPGPLPPAPMSNPFAAPSVLAKSPAPSAPSAVSADEDEEVDDDAMTHVVASPADLPTNRPPGLRPRDSHPEGDSGTPIGARPAQNAVATSGAFPPPAFEASPPVPPVVIAPPEATSVRTQPPPATIPSYPPPPVLDATTKALIALIVVLSIGLTIVLFLLWRRS